MIEPARNSITSVEELDDLLSQPTDAVVETLHKFSGDVVILGVAGKMGPTLTRMVRKASNQSGTPRRVIGVARFSDPEVATRLQGWGIETIAADLLDRQQVARLPEAPLVVYMAGRKFGSTGQESLTWAMNAYLPALVCERYRDSRIVAFSTGNVYGYVPVSSGGSRETDPLRPVGEYAQSCLARERMFEHFSQTQGTPTAIIRLNYACELRYGILVDLALQVWRNEPIDLTMGAFNILWQADANAHALCALADCGSPAVPINVTGPETLRVRDVCEQLGRLLNRTPQFVGTESVDALLNDASAALERYGSPRVSAEQLLVWIADWIRRDAPRLDKPTHFASRDGRF